MTGISVRSKSTLPAVLIIFIFLSGNPSFANASIFSPGIGETALVFSIEGRIERQIFNLVNQERRKRHLSILKLDRRLAKIARFHSNQMAIENFFSHYDPDGLTVVDRARDFKVNRWTKIGENLFTSRGYQNPAPLALRGWKKSRLHRANLFDEVWNRTGIGVAIARSGDIYITQVFLAE